jgi:methionyl-tRNA formyltransferase
VTTPRDLAIAIVTQDDPFYIPAFIGPFLDAAPRRGISTRLVVITSAFGESTGKLARRMWTFYGPAGFVKRSLAYATALVMARAGGTPRTVERIARAHDIPVRRVTNVNDPALIDDLRCLDLNVILSVSAPQVFKKDLLSIPTWGCVNIHAAKLPKYRGMMPNFWAFYHGDPSAGVTVHRMDEGLDRGKILLQGDVEIRHEDTLHDLMIRSKVEAARIAVEALGRVRDSTIELRDYEGAGSYFSFPTREHVQELRARGKRLL